MRLRQWGIAAAAFTVIVGSFLLMNFLSSQKKVPEQQAKEASTVSVKVDTVRYSEVKAGLAASGRVSSQAEVDLSSEVQGRLLPGDLSFRKGQSFNKGQILIRVFDEDVEYALKARKSGFLTSLANLLPDLKVDYPSTYPTWLSFFNAIKIDQEFPAMPDLVDEKLRIFLSSRGVLSEFYAIKAEEVRLSKYIVRAPFNGIITETYLEPGSVANPGTRLARIIHTGMLEVEVPIAASLAPRISTGSRVLLKADGFAWEWTGRVVRRSAFVDPLTQSVPIFVSVPYDDNRPLYQGQYLRAEFPEVTFDGGFSIPRNALVENEYVYAVVDGKLAKRRIFILHAGDSHLIVQGITEGQQVVTIPLVNVSENTRVEILN